MVEWLLTEQLVEIFRAARQQRPELNADLEAHSIHGEEDVLAGAGTAATIHALDGSEYLVTPRRIARVVGDEAYDLILLADLVGYDWISPDMSEKVALKTEHYDRLYLYPRDAPTVVLDRLGQAVYPLMTFLGRAVEFRSQKVLLRKLDDEVVDLLGRCLVAVVRSAFFEEHELVDLFGRDRGSLDVVAGMWPRMNLGSAELRELLRAVTRALVERGPGQVAEWDRWIGGPAERVTAAFEVFERVSTGEV